MTPFSKNFLYLRRAESKTSCAIDLSRDLLTAPRGIDSARVPIRDINYSDSLYYSPELKNETLPRALLLHIDFDGGFIDVETFCTYDSLSFLSGL